MKKMIFLICLGIPFTLPFSCVKDQKSPNCDEESIVVPITALAEDMDTINCSLQNIAESQQTVNLIITSQADYEKYIRCGNGSPAVDFTKYFLVAGRTKLTACGRLKEQRVVLQCDAMEYIVDIEDMDCQALTDVPYFALVPRQYVDLPVVFTIKRN